MQLLNQSTVIENNNTESSILPLRPIEKQDLTPKTYTQVIESSLKHTNATGNIYFSNYFDWQGSARERWFLEYIDEKMLQHEGVFVTKSAVNNYLIEGLPFQSITCKLNTYDIKRCSFYILFSFYIDGQLASTGYQNVAFKNHQGRISAVPGYALNRVKKFEITEEKLNKYLRKMLQ